MNISNGNSFFRALGPLPSISPFWGRLNELKQLTETILERKYPVISITSISGKGKSSLVWNMLCRLPCRHKIFKTVYWINCRNVLNSAHLFKRLLMNGDSGAFFQQGNASLDDLLCKVMEKLGDSPNLLVLDNMEGLYKMRGCGKAYGFPFEIKEFLHRLHVRDHGSQVITTSRMKLFTNELNDISSCQKEMQIKGVDKDATYQILIHEGVHKGIDHLGSTIEFLEGHPQFLRLIGQYITQVYNGDASLFGSGTNGLFEKLFPLIKEQIAYLSPEAFKLLQYLSVFPDPFNDEVLGVISAWDNFDVLEKSVNELTRWHILERDTVKKCFRIPSIIRLFCYKTCSGKKEIHRKLVSYYLEKSKNKTLTKPPHEPVKNLLYALNNALLGKDFIQAKDILFQQGVARYLHYSCRDIKLREYLEILVSQYQGNNNGNREDQLILLNTLGETYERLGDVSSALLQYSRILELSNSSYDDKKLLQRACLGMGRVFLMIEDFHKARRYLKKSLTLSQQKNDSAILAEIYYHYGSMYIKYKKYMHAFKVLFYSQSLLGKNNNLLMKGKVFLELAKCYHGIDDMPSAFKYLESAKKFFQEIKYPVGTRDVLLEKANWTAGMIGLDEAIPILEKSLELARRYLPVSYEKEVWSVWGQACFTSGDPVKAIPYFEKSLRIHQLVGNLSGATKQLFFAANAYSEIGDQDMAIKYLRNALELILKCNFQVQSSSFLVNLGKIFVINKKYPLALACFEESLNYMDKSNKKLNSHLNSYITELKTLTGKKKFKLIKQSLKSRRNHFLACAIGAKNWMILHGKPVTW